MGGNVTAAKPYLAAGCMTANKLLEDLGFTGFPHSKRMAVVATFPPPRWHKDRVAAVLGDG